ncbi:hypothetical protein MAP00_008913 [Monascus purpureus]|nr:hypothetical protein MAP00_008913 [Monascus purpureus]
MNMDNNNGRKNSIIQSPLAIFPLASPPPKYHVQQTLRISPLRRLQIQQLSPRTGRPAPVLEVWKPSLFAPTKVLRTGEFPDRTRLTRRDYYITQTGEYMAFSSRAASQRQGDKKARTKASVALSGDGDSQNNKTKRKQKQKQDQEQPDQIHWQNHIVAVIRTPTKSADGGQGRIYLRHGRMWKATTASDDVYRFTVADDRGLHIIVQCEKVERRRRRKSRRSSHGSASTAATPRLSMSSTTTEEEREDANATFDMKIVNLETKASVSIGSVDRRSISLSLDQGLSGAYEEFKACLSAPGVFGFDLDGQAYVDKDWEGMMYTLVVTFGTWIALQRGWTN